jgi:hypothetical protein
MATFVPSHTLLRVILVFATMLAGCATAPRTSGPMARGYLRFEVEPEDAEIEIDEQYSGVITGWAANTVPVEPGVRRVTVRAEGYITQRFDIEVSAGEEVTLILEMEPVLELDPEDSSPSRDRFRPRDQFRRPRLGDRR